MNLKDGMEVTLRNGDIYTVLGNGLYSFSYLDQAYVLFCKLDLYDKNLQSVDFDIIEVRYDNKLLWRTEIV
tara:strand:+ start:556 stop:768 length:213 start_codon:yes stop_codon:yes gene_type:complete